MDRGRTGHRHAKNRRHQEVHVVKDSVVCGSVCLMKSRTNLESSSPPGGQCMSQTP